MNWTEIIPLLPQFGLVILFMYYQERQNGTWQKFLHEEGEKDRISIESLTKVVSEMNAMLIAHDAKTNPIAGDIERIRERLAQAGIGHIEDSPLPPGRVAK